MISTSVAGQISSDSSNVVELVTILISNETTCELTFNDKVRAMYQKITTSIKIEDNSTSSVSVHYTSDCNGRKTEKKRSTWAAFLNLELCPRRRCRNIPLGTPVTFTAHVTLKWVIFSFSLRVIHKTFSGNVQVLALTSSGEKYTEHFLVRKTQTDLIIDFPSQHSASWSWRAPSGRGEIPIDYLLLCIFFPRIQIDGLPSYLLIARE